MVHNWYMADIDQQPTWNFGPDEWKPDRRDRARGKAAIREIRQTLARACPPLPAVHQRDDERKTA